MNFWEQLEATENLQERLLVLGNFNGRIGKKDVETEETIGIHGEMIRNNNGKRLIVYCFNNNLVIANTFFDHKEIHKHTSQEQRGEINHRLIYINKSKLQEYKSKILECKEDLRYIQTTTQYKKYSFQKGKM